ncbi:hypothetical protein QE450_003657 [Paenibacillus sp. SORGH_AS306]|uniref:hypothetical protein n=1 Tax=unclassified Paenibacillus TaxID=185978 RepID=UPI00277E59FE|nr:MULTISPECIES: hypothetical protein [unclassified Paenibacillus]MDQ1236159.1 hypothetical protein [Paenibacillus sp. SORGH_AS_0306]MDR6108514.1 hypothetical protein [Paenibacillus sp. SORGH_AS_0338]
MMKNTKTIKIMLTSVMALSLTIPALSSVSAQANTTTKAISTQATTKTKVDKLTPEQEKSLVDIAGFDNVKQFTGFYNNLRRSVAKNDKEAVANRISYPLSVYSNNHQRKILNKKQFIAEYDTIMTAKTKKALADQRLDNLFIRDQGVKIGSGEMWIAMLDDKPGVYTINQNLHD